MQSNTHPLLLVFYGVVLGFTLLGFALNFSPSITATAATGLQIHCPATTVVQQQLSNFSIWSDQGIIWHLTQEKMGTQQSPASGNHDIKFDLAEHSARTDSLVCQYTLGQRDTKNFSMLRVVANPAFDMKILPYGNNWQSAQDQSSRICSETDITACRAIAAAHQPL